MIIFLNIIARIGSGCLIFLFNVGSVVTFMLISLSYIFRPPFYIKNFSKYLLEILFFSLPIVAMTNIFSGFVLALQAYSGFVSAVADRGIPSLIALAMTRELAPVLSGLMVAGKISSSIASEISSMKTTEQLDAISTMGINYYQLLITPRILAGIIALPILVLVGDVLGMFGGFIISVTKLHISSITYIVVTLENITWFNISIGLTKAVCFGLIVTSIGCYQGIKSSKGSIGVGLATTNAIVSSSILILMVNFFITSIFFG